MNTEKDTQGCNLKQWLYVVLCALAIFSTIPVARGFQRFISNTVGREFFNYFVISVICTGLILLLYLFIFKLKIKSPSQYFWLVICAGIYFLLNSSLNKAPEEGIHILEYGLLSYLTFRALSHNIRDYTIYPTAGLFVLLVGIIDEFLQWLMPERYWGFNDVRLNGLAGGIFLLALWKGIKPKVISQQVQKTSIRIFAGILTVNLILLGLCLSNTPEAVKFYTAPFKALSWLRIEEPMAEYGYKHEDPEIGVFYSRFTLKALKGIDSDRGEHYGKIMSKEIKPGYTFNQLIKTYNPCTNPFLYEFATHLFRRNDDFDELAKADNQHEIIRKSNIVFRENLIIEKYFRNTVKHSGLAWPGEKVNNLKKTALLQNEDYISNAGQLITAFTQKTALIIIFIVLIVVWTALQLWGKISDAD